MGYERSGLDGGLSACHAQTNEVMLCVHLILLPTIVLQPLASDRLFSMLDHCGRRRGGVGTRSYPSPALSRGPARTTIAFSVAVASFTDAGFWRSKQSENTLTLRGEKQVTTTRKKSGDVLYQWHRRAELRT